MSQLLPPRTARTSSQQPDRDLDSELLPPLASTKVEVPADDALPQPADTAERVSTSRRSTSARAVIMWLAIAPTLHAIPWLVDGAPLCGLAAIACGLFLASRTGVLASFWFTWLWSTLAISAAFYWSPSAMAYTLSSDLWLGIVVAAPLILWDGLRLALGYWIGGRITRQVHAIWLPAALSTIAVEALLPSVFPWRLGFMILPWTWFTQAVDLFGALWPTFAAFAAAGLLLSATVWAWRRWGGTPAAVADERAGMLLDEPATVRPSSGTSSNSSPRSSTLGRRAVWAAGIVVGLNLIYGQWAMWYWQGQSDQAPKTHFALVQVDPSFTHSLGQSQKLTAAVADDVELVCWPESSGGNYELSLRELSDHMKVFACSREPERGLRPWPSPTCELLLGGKNYVGDRDEPEQIYVTAMLLDEKERIAARYNKRFLMPFGEYVPFEETVPGLAELFDMAEHMTPGMEAQVLPSQTGARLGTMLCYEDMVPAAAREMTLAGANVLVSLINGSAFESPHTLKQHRLLAQLRALECRRTFLRCAATGETCVISPLGEIVDRLPVQQNGVLKSEVALVDRTTVYTHAPWLGSTLCFLGLGFLLIRPKDNRDD